MCVEGDVGLACLYLSVVVPTHIPIRCSMYLTAYLYKVKALHIYIYICQTSHVSTCTSVSLIICLSVYLSIHLSIYLSIYRSLYAYVCLSDRLSVGLSVDLTIYLCLFCLLSFLQVRSFSCGSSSKCFKRPVHQNMWA